jgi:hypothetical protein
MLMIARFGAIVICLAMAGCGTTGGSVIPDGRDDLSPGKAVIAFTVQVTDGTTYDNCSVFTGHSAATAQWFAWPVEEDAVAVIALEVEPGRYGFHRFGCMFRGLQLSTSVRGPDVDVADGDVLYLGRLIVSDTGMGSAAGFSRMPTSVSLTFENHEDEDIGALGLKWPLFATRIPSVAIPPTWGGELRYPLRPYQDGVKLVAAPIL